MSVREYHSQKYSDGKIIGKNRFNRYIGLELEVDRKYESGFSRDSFVDYELEEFNENLYFENDGSLNNGFECVTYPHSYKALMEFDWDKFTGILQENEFTGHDNDTAGLHIHFSKEWFKNHSHVNRILMSMYKFKDFFVKFSRRKQEDLDMWARIRSAKSIFDAQVVYDGERYSCLNKNTSTGETYEFRIFKSSLNPTTIKASIDLCVALIKITKNKEWEFMADLAGFRLVDLILEEKAMTKNLARYLVVRKLATEEQVKDYLETKVEEPKVVEIKDSKIYNQEEIMEFFKRNIRKNINYKLKEFKTGSEYYETSVEFRRKADINSSHYSGVHFNKEMLAYNTLYGYERNNQKIQGETIVEFNRDFICCISWLEWIEPLETNTEVEYNDVY